MVTVVHRQHERHHVVPVAAVEAEPPHVLGAALGGNVADAVGAGVRVGEAAVDLNTAVR